jgi:hypothetical protein
VPESRKTRTRFWNFDPVEFLDCLSDTDAEAGKIFKAVLRELIADDVPEGSPARPMFDRTHAFRELQRQKALDYWKSQRSPQAPPAAPLRPPRPPTPQKTRPPTIQDVYDYCDSAGIPPPVGREWYEWQDNKGWLGLKCAWQTALRGFAAKKHKQEVINDDTQRC